jgi:predicted peroxiredoxin
MARLLYVGTHGTDDPTAATFPFLMAKGAIEAGHETGIILMGEIDGLSSDPRGPNLGLRTLRPGPWGH